MNIEEDVKQEGSTLGLIKISLVSKTARENQKAYNYSQQNENGKCSQLILNDEKEFSNDVVFIPFVDSDHSNFLKLKRALEHLKDIYKKEDKPYAN